MGETRDTDDLFLFILQTSHKKTFYYLEQLILKHKLHQNALNIKEIHGMSLYLFYIFMRDSAWCFSVVLCLD